MQHLKARYLVNKAETDIVYTLNILILVMDLIVRLLLLMVLLAFAFENHLYQFFITISKTKQIKILK